MSYTVDLSSFQKPDIIEDLRFEEIYAQKKARLIAYNAEYAKALALESDPLAQELQAASYGEMLLRQRINQAALATMLPFSTGTNLDAIGANYNVVRLVITPENPNTLPLTPAVLESDERLRTRIQMALEARTTAGSRDSYIFHILSADSSIKSVSILTPRFAQQTTGDRLNLTVVNNAGMTDAIPGDVAISFLTEDGKGVPDGHLVEQVLKHLNAEHIRPLTDNPRYVAPQIIEYQVRADLILYPDVKGAFAKAQAIAAISQFCQTHHQLGHDITLSAVTAALHVAGVQKVVVHEPAQDIVINDQQAAYNTGITVEVAGYDI